MTACILLAGGLGTRLRPAVDGIPKCLAPVAGTPFLEIQVRQLAAQGIERFVLALGYRAEAVIELAERLQDSIAIDWVVERRPLGTGGAALFAMERAALSEALVANADTFLDADLTALRAPLQRAAGERVRMLVVSCADGGRFGEVAIKAGRAERFLPGGHGGPALVNAGIYRIHRDAFAGRRPGERFSLEADVIEALAAEGGVCAAVAAGTFVDIGVPDDYFRLCAQLAFRHGPAAI